MSELVSFPPLAPQTPTPPGSLAIPFPPPTVPNAEAFVAGFVPTPLPTAGDIVRQSSGSTTEVTVFGTQITSFHYTLVIQVPLPFFNINVAAWVAGFIKAELTKLGIPQAIDKVVKKLKDIINNIVLDIQALMEAIPTISIAIQVRVQTVTLINIVLVTEKVPTTIPIPTFSLGLPNFDFTFPFVIPFPSIPPIFVRVPVPVPVIHIPKLFSITGGDVSVALQAKLVPPPHPIPATLPGVPQIPSIPQVPTIPSNPINLPKI